MGLVAVWFKRHYEECIVGTTSPSSLPRVLTIICARYEMAGCSPAKVKILLFLPSLTGLSNNAALVALENIAIVSVGTDQMQSNNTKRATVTKNMVVGLCCWVLDT
ncbi:hypothetical protein EVAR_72449_1 [Eumeta japonica]|uniref:Uncharacterized protein n=1 Tax=Eumeta variegata TaxID=151549 RepID=A0A4C1SRC5_EUMVA|nr:hypothetical protein EVAR_72449_1 [Eumeta japonica]